MNNQDEKSGTFDEEKQQQQSIHYTELFTSSSSKKYDTAAVAQKEDCTTETYNFSMDSLSTSTCESDHSSQNESGEDEKTNGPIFDFAPEIKDGIIYRGEEKADSPRLMKSEDDEIHPNCLINLNKMSTSPELILFGYDLSHFSPSVQFAISATGVLVFNMCYGYLQELIQIQIAGRSFAIFLGACQFLGYAFWSGVLSKRRSRGSLGKIRSPLMADSSSVEKKGTNPPPRIYFALSILRSVDLALTNLSMKYLNYPAKTLIKSSRVVFTMFLGVIIGNKKYNSADYIMVLMLVLGLGVFLHADMTTDAIFNPVGVLMLLASLTLDGTVSNCSEVIMKRHNLGQDEFQMNLYTYCFIIMLIAAYQSHELYSGVVFFFFSDGTFSEYKLNDGILKNSWSAKEKALVVILFSTFGIFGGSCAASITKRFGALTMSITTTTRKAATVFLSFAMFPNACTYEHVCGVVIFLGGLFLKAFRNCIKDRTKQCFKPPEMLPSS